MENQEVKKSEMKVKKIVSNELTIIEKTTLRVLLESRVKYIKNELMPMFDDKSALDRSLKVGYLNDIVDLNKIIIKLMK